MFGSISMHCRLVRSSFIWTWFDRSRHSNYSSTSRRTARKWLIQMLFHSRILFNWPHLNKAKNLDDCLKGFHNDFDFDNGFRRQWSCCKGVVRHVMRFMLCFRNIRTLLFEMSFSSFLCSITSFARSLRWVFAAAGDSLQVIFRWLSAESVCERERDA